MRILDLNSRVFLAPMAGITDKPMRRLVSSFGGGNIVSEMVAINALSRKNPKTYRIADVRDESYPVIVQLVGSDAKIFDYAAKLAYELGAHALDINMGCPVRKIVNGNSGSYLMTDMPQAAKIIETVVRATPLKVSVKFRKGWDCRSINAVEFAKMCEESGASYVTVHGRTRSEFYSGKADWDIIAAVKNAISIPVIGNGDILSPGDARRMVQETGCAGVALARFFLKNPGILNAIRNGKLPSPQTCRRAMLSEMRNCRSELGPLLEFARTGMEQQEFRSFLLELGIRKKKT